MNVTQSTPKVPALGAAPNRLRWRHALLTIGWLSFALLAHAANTSTRPASLPAEIMPLAQRALLLDVTLAGDRAVAVGERGHILLSDDYGITWRQVNVPTRATLTAVYFVDAQWGWAVGHDNVILQTRDGGASWRMQYPPGNVGNSFLDVVFFDREQGIAVGAYGMAMRTRNGGETWVPHTPSEDDMHFNRISQGPDGRLFIAVEGGDLLSSTDMGNRWDYLDSPYDGSLFGLLPLSNRVWLTYGLRGNVFRSTDAGQSWSAIDLTAPVLITAAVRMASGTIVLAGQGEQFFRSRDGGRTFTLWRVPVQAAANLAEMPDGSLLAVGLNGVWRLQP